MADFDFKASLRSRLSAVRPTRWVRFGIVAAVYLLWVVWLGNPWWALGVLLFAELVYYTTKLM